MATTSWRFPGTTASVSPGDVAWSDLGNITADDANPAAASLNATQTSEILKATNFGFVSGDFPAGWTISGIEIEVDRVQVKTGTCEARDHTVQLYDASGTLTGSNVADTATNWPNGSYGTKTYGGAGNMLGTSLTASDFQDADFGVAFRAQATSGTASTIGGVDYIRVRAHLDPPPSGYEIVGIGTVAETTSSGGNLTLTEPAGVQEGDLLVACISYRSNASFSNGGIWTKGPEQNSGNTTANGTGSIGSGVAFYGLRGASAPDLVFERTGGNVARGFIIAYRATDYPTKVFEYDQGTSLTLAAASTSFTMTGFTPAQDETLLVWCGWGARNTTLSAFDAATDPTTESGTTTDTTTDPYFGTWLRRVTSGTSTGADCTVALADAVQENATASGNFTYTAGSSARHAGGVMAFRLVSGAGDATALPGAGSLTLTGQAPSVSAGASVSPGVASLTITGYAPTVSTATSVTVTPGAGALTLTGLTPTVSASASAAPGAGALTLTGLAPSVAAGASATPGAGSLTISGLSPSVAASATVTPGAASLTITGHAPTVAANSNAAPATGTLTLTGYAPDVTAVNDNVEPDVEAGSGLLGKHRRRRSAKGHGNAWGVLEWALESTDEWKRIIAAAEKAESVVADLAPVLPKRIVNRAAALAADLPDFAAVEARIAGQMASEIAPLVADAVARKARQLIALADEAMRIAAERAEEDDIEAMLLMVA